MNIEGNIYGRLTAIKEVRKNKHRKSVWLFQCSCGNTKEIVASDVKFGRTRSCGCYNKEILTGEDIRGKKYNRLLVIKHDGFTKDGNKKWLCLCDCGNYSYAERRKLVNGNRISCGCLQRERVAKMASDMCGDKSPSWKGGISTKANKDRNCKRAIKWRKDIFYRDNYTCQRCNIRGKNINAHHLESFTHNEELRYELDNGITFCVECHKEFHKIYGKFGFVKDNTYEFIEREVVCQ